LKRKKLEIAHKELVDVSQEEKELLDEKINQIIKKYKKRRRTRSWVTVLIFIAIIAVLGFVGYSYLYYINNGVPPFGIPVFW